MTVNCVIWGWRDAHWPLHRPVAVLCLRAAADKKMRKPRKEPTTGDVKDNLGGGTVGATQSIYNRFGMNMKYALHEAQNEKK